MRNTRPTQKRHADGLQVVALLLLLMMMMMMMRVSALFADWNTGCQPQTAHCHGRARLITARLKSSSVWLCVAVPVDSLGRFSRPRTDRGKTLESLALCDWWTLHAVLWRCT